MSEFALLPVPATDENLTIIGFDLGHGETALASTRLATTDEPRTILIHGARTIPTIVGQHRDGRVVFGVTAGRMAADMAESFERFKSPDLMPGGEAARAVRMFVAAIAESLQADRQVADFGQAHVFVGHPSGWPPQAVDDYRTLLRQSGLPLVDVVPESRAAFVHARESGELNLSMDELSRRVLIMDFGSSTTDFTATLGLAAQPLDFGDIALGAGIIDGILMRHMIERTGRRIEAEAALQRMPGKRTDFALACRGAKEQFFNAEKLNPDAVIEADFRIETGLTVAIDIDRRTMDSVLAERSPLLQGMSWREALDACLLAVRQRTEAPDLIILTGGAARMRFVQQAVAEAFPQTRITMSQEPELAIAKGLALYGRLLLKTGRFRTQIDALVASDAFRQLIAAAVPGLIGRQADAVAAGLAQGPIRGAIAAWRDGEVSTIDAMGARIARDCEAWVQGPEARIVIAKSVTEWLETIRLRLEQMTDPFCERYGIPRRMLSLRGHTLGSLSSGKVGTPDVIGDVTVVQTIAAAIATVLAAKILLAIHILLGTHPVGWAIAVVVSIVSAAVGVDEGKRILQGITIPGWTRGWLLSEGKVEKLLTEAAATISAQLKKELEKSEAEGPESEKLATRLSEEIGAAIRQRADDAILLIR